MKSLLFFLYIRQVRNKINLIVWHTPQSHWGPLVFYFEPCAHGAGLMPERYDFTLKMFGRYCSTEIFSIQANYFGGHLYFVCKMCLFVAEMNVSFHCAVVLISCLHPSSGLHLRAPLFCRYPRCCEFSFCPMLPACRVVVTRGQWRVHLHSMLAGEQPKVLRWWSAELNLRFQNGKRIVLLGELLLHYYLLPRWPRQVFTCLSENQSVEWDSSCAGNFDFSRQQHNLI